MEECLVLANVECRYCHDKGHTPKKCPKTALKKKRDDEWAKRHEENQKKREKKLPTLIQEPKGKSETPKKSTWTSLVVNSLSEADRELMEQQNLEQCEKEAEERTKESARKKKKWEERNKLRILKQYGLAADNGIFPEGSFWYFFTEGTKDDIAEAKTLRKNSNNQYEFKKYLKEKYYWLYWLCRSEGTEDDCQILDRWRWEEEKAEYERKEREKDEADRYGKEQIAIRETMESKLEKGEITQREYNEWQWERDISDDDFIAAESYRYRSEQYHIERDYKAWKDRSDARKKK
jgi:hypothetical protein